jgi:hypothetical protein
MLADLVHYNNIIALHCFKAWSFNLVLLRTPVAFVCAAFLLRPLGVLRQLRCGYCWCLYFRVLHGNCFSRAATAGFFYGNCCSASASARCSTTTAVPLLQGVLRQLLYRYCYCPVFYRNYDRVMLTSDAAFASVPAVMRLHTTSIGLLLRYGQSTTRGKTAYGLGGSSCP